MTSYLKYLLFDLADPRTKDWFLLEPLSFVALEVFYFSFIYYIGPKFMAKRRPYHLKRIIIVYNIAQILINAFLVFLAVTFGWNGTYKIFCEPLDSSPAGLKAAYACWLYHINKVIDLLDTVFYIFQKKYNKVTTLHVYHHSGMIVCSWFCARFYPGGHHTSVGLVNAIVHVIMYTYYLWTALNCSKPWWKKYLTQLQITQFVLLFLQFSIALMKKDCEFPKALLALFLPQVSFMALLFIDFYYRTYIQKRPTSQDQDNVLKKTESKQNGVEFSNGKSKKH